MYRWSPGVVLPFVLLFVAACAEPKCPDGFDKVGSICKCADASVEPAAIGDSGVEADDTGADPTHGDGTRGDVDVRDMDSAIGRADSSDGPSEDAGELNDAAHAAPDGGATSVLPPECDDGHPCAPGLLCSKSVCVSACTQKKCDPNATCSVVNGVATCACSGSFVAIPGMDGTISCARDVACDCDSHATCEIDSNQLHHCRCKPGYTGDGTTCTPLSCPTPTLTNGTVTTSDGTNNFDVTATYRCISGYEPAGGSSTRKCGADQAWTGTQPTCKPVDCGAPDLPKMANGRVNGAVSTPTGTSFQNVAKYSCFQGFSLQGEAERECGANKKWSGMAPRCLGCGDGYVSAELGESCDPKAEGGDNLWVCNAATCQAETGTAYKLCKSYRDCDTGQDCRARTCQPSNYCVYDSACPSAPRGIHGIPHCYTPVCFIINCYSELDCPPGLVCAGSSSNSSESPSVCVPCSADTPCPEGKTCEMDPDEIGGHCK